MPCSSHSIKVYAVDTTRHCCYYQPLLPMSGSFLGGRITPPLPLDHVDRGKAALSAQTQQVGSRSISQRRDSVQKCFSVSPHQTSAWHACSFVSDLSRCLLRVSQCNPARPDRLPASCGFNFSPWVCVQSPPVLLGEFTDIACLIWVCSVSLSHLLPLQETPGSSSVWNGDIMNEGPEFVQIFFVFTGCPLFWSPGTPRACVRVQPFRAFPSAFLVKTRLPEGDRRWHVSQWHGTCYPSVSWVMHQYYNSFILSSSVFVLGAPQPLKRFFLICVCEDSLSGLRSSRRLINTECQASVSGRLVCPPDPLVSPSPSRCTKCLVLLVICRVCIVAFFTPSQVWYRTPQSLVLYTAELFQTGLFHSAASIPFPLCLCLTAHLSLSLRDISGYT